MYFRDALRAQYYLRVLAEGQTLITRALCELQAVLPVNSPATIAEGLALQVADTVDQILLPTVAHEVFAAKLRGGLIGDTPEQRYDSFFIRDGAWTPSARAIPDTYPFLFSMIDHFVRSSFGNIEVCLRALLRDLPLISGTLLTGAPAALTGMRVAQSDRHRGGSQAVILSFSLDFKLVYKATDVRPDQLFAEFCSLLHLSPRYAPRCMRSLPVGEHGWFEFIPQLPCRDVSEVQAYYRRAGALLAIADTLNYCDGHFENLVANGDSPVLIDCETLFHVFGEVDPQLGERSVLFTGLVQKPPDLASGRGFTAAFQTPTVERFEFLHAYALNDHRDDITVRFRGIIAQPSQNCPTLQGAFQPPSDYIEEFAEGFTATYDAISSRADALISNDAWWSKVACVQARQLVRHTLYYQLLIRKIQQPEACTSVDSAREMIRPLLTSSNNRLEIVAAYELKDLLNLDVPYFYHHPGGRDLFDGDAHRYASYLPCSAVEDIRRELSCRSGARRDRALSILRNVLRFTPRYEQESTGEPPGG
jgi:lantibiotic modifying enzyme